MTVPLWEITLSGRFGVRLGNRDLSHFRTRKTAALLAYLAYHSHRTHSREELLELLWPEHDLEAARNLLRVTLTYLRKGMEVDGSVFPLLSDRDQVRLDASAVTTDRAAFDTLVDAAHRTDNEADKLRLLQQAASLYRGELLDSMDESWIVGERQRWNDAYLVALRQIIKVLVAQRSLETALEYGLRAVVVDKYREESHRTLMRLYVAMGRRDAAVLQYKTLSGLLRDELEISPSAVTISLLAEIQNPDSQAVKSKSAAVASPNAEAVELPCAPVPPAMPAAPATKTTMVLPRLPAAPSTPLFGRDEDLLRLTRMLDTPETRLITLTGLGGVGKTRLALATAKSALALFESNVAFVELAALIQPDQIADAILSALPIMRGVQSLALEQVSAFLADRKALLVLDNCEHLLPEASATIHALMEAAPQLTCLVTSRERLRLRYEYEFPVRRLPTPPTVQSTVQAVLQTSEDFGHLTEYASVAMFVERAQQARPGFVMTADNAATIGILCSRLEGLPLAIELAAAWTRTLTPAQIEKRLTSCLNLLVTTQKDVPARHASLRAALDGSYQLLSQPLQTFLAKLSVFRGGLTLEAAEAVCEEPEALSYLAQLCEGSLIIAEASGEAMRYRLLEMVLEYAKEKAQEKTASGGTNKNSAGSKQARLALDLEVLQQKHAHYFREWAQTQEKQLKSEHTARILRELDAEHDNLRTALEWCVEQGEAGQREASDEGLLLASALWRYWDSRGYSRDGLEWFDRLLQNVQGDKSIRIEALSAAGTLAYRNSRIERVQDYCNEALLLCRAAQDRRGEAMALSMIGNIARQEDKGDQARVAYEQALATARELNDVSLIASSLANLGNSARDADAYELAMRYYLEAMLLFQQMHDRFSQGLTFINMSYLHLHAERYNECKKTLHRVLEVAEELGDRSMQRRSVSIGALLAVGQRDWTRGTLLLSAAETMRIQSEIQQVPANAEAQSKALQAILAHISVATFESLWEQGRTLTWQDMNACINGEY